MLFVIQIVMKTAVVHGPLDYLAIISDAKKFRSGACPCTHCVFFHKKWSYKYAKDPTAARTFEAEIEAQKGKVKKISSELAQVNDKITTSISKVMIHMEDLRRIGPQNTYAYITTTEVQRMQQI